MRHPKNIKTLTNGYPKFSNALTKMMDDLKSKEEMLAMFGQKEDIYNNLTYLQDTYEVSLTASRYLSHTPSANAK